MMRLVPYPSLLLIAAGVWAGPVEIGSAQQPSPGAGRLAPQRSPAAESPDGPPSALRQLIADIVRDQIPHRYEDKSRWGSTTERWDGLHIQLDRLRLKTKRRRKRVNDGDWQMYRIDLADPDRLDIQIQSLQPTDDGRVAFDGRLSAPVHAFGRVSKWVQGVQLYSISADANATVVLRARGNVALVLDPTKVPPDVGLDPEITGAELRLEDFRVYRVSKVGGEAARQLGRRVRSVLEKKIAENNRKLADKLNRHVRRHQGELRFSLHDLLASKWAELAKFIREQSATDTQKPQAGRRPPRGP